MAHPFRKMFEVALKKSVRNGEDENYVLIEAEKLLDKGYRPQEIFEVLDGFSRGIVDDTDASIVREAREEFSRHLPD